jgi:phage terminase large subunit
MYQPTTAVKKILKLGKRIRGIAGGSSAGKTIAILLWLIDKAQTNNNLLISVVSETFPHLKRGAMRDFLNIMETHNSFENKRWNKTDCIYEFKTHSIIEFFSADQPGKVRGPRRDIIFINEANNISYETYTQLEIRTKDIVWLDWNPVSEFWFYTQVKQGDVDFLTLTYKDNEALDPKQVDALEARMGNKNWWRVYGLGLLGVIEGRIYSDWNFVDDVPHEAKLFCRGLDFGYTNDPSALVAAYQFNDGYILDEELYRRGMTNNQIADFLNNLSYSLVKADSAEPKSIEEIKQYGINIVPVLKGRDSIRQGIQYVQDQRISVTKRSVNLIKEYRSYLWQQDNDGKFLNKPEGGGDHCFIGSTYIQTDKGLVMIKQIKKGMNVLTSNGCKNVLKKWNNGERQVTNYLLQYDTGCVNIVCTPDHKVKVGNIWKKISKLQSGDKVYLSRDFLEKYGTSIQEKGIFQKGQKGCTLPYGNTLEGKSLKDFISIIKMGIHGIIDWKIWHWLKHLNIFRFTQNYVSKTIRFSQESFREKELLLLPFGTKLQRGWNGTVDTLLKSMQREYLQNVSVNFVGNIIKQETQKNLNTAIKIVKLKHFVVGESWKENVYDLTVEESHEYFANGILVHNCMDCVRYLFDESQKAKTNKENYKYLPQFEIPMDMDLGL